MLNRILAIAVLLAAQTAGSARADPQKLEADDFTTQRDVPGRFDYYALVLSWSPTHCSTTDRGTDDAQCKRDDGARFGFVLHGLWPQYEQGFPARCFTRWKPYVTDQVVATMADVMPSKALVIHEYREHGTCSGMRPDAFFAFARRAFTGITIPQRYRNPRELQFISPRDVMTDFLRANPALRPEMIAVNCDGSALRDVRVCLTREGRPRACGLNERKGASCRGTSLRVLPVRSSKWDYGNNRSMPLKPLTPPKPSPKGSQTLEVPRR